MSRKSSRRWAGGTGKAGNPRPETKFEEFVRGHDPKVMEPLMVALSKRRTLFSWLTPGKSVVGVPDWAGEDLPWLTLIDDLHSEASGPTSFDSPSLKWWSTRAGVLVIDAATPTGKLYAALGSQAADGYLTLIVQTVEARRLLWHEYFVSVRPPDMPTLIVHHLKKPGPEGPKQVLRAGKLDDDFVSDRPIGRAAEDLSEDSFAIVSSLCRQNSGKQRPPE
jgi:hypothetical protein